MLMTGKTLTIAGVNIEPGKIIRKWVSVTDNCDGQLQLPLILIGGKKEGPTVYVQSGIHGDEYDGLEAALRVVETVDPNTLAGNLVVVPRVNVPAFREGTRRSGIDGVDMNRIFPGRADGFLAEQLANFVVKEIVPHVNYAIDLHGGNTELEVVSYGGWRSTKSFDALPMAKIMGLRHLWDWDQDSKMRGTFMHAAADLDVPTVMIEIGGGNRWTEECVQDGVRAIMNVLKYLKMVEGEYEGLPREILTLRGGFVHATKGGFLRPKVQLGQVVKKGEVLAQVVSLLGEPVDELVSPRDGIVNDIRTMPRILPGEWTYLIGEVVERTPVPATAGGKH